MPGKLSQVQAAAVGGDCPVYNFGALQRLVPPGCAVFWNGSHYQAVTADGQITPQHWSPHACLRWVRAALEEK